MKTWLGYLSTRRAVNALSTRNELPVRQRASPALHGLRAGYAPRIHAAHVVASSQPAQAPSANTPRQLRPWAGRGSGKTSRRCERLSVPITKSHCRESTRRKRGRQLNRHTPAVSRACRSGNRRHHGPNAMGPSHGRATSSCKHLDAWWSLTDASQDSHPPGNCTAWPHPGSRCKPSPAQTVVA